MIHRIRIQNFKSLRDVTVDLSPVTVFVGRSGTGKTNFASAIRFLRDYLAFGPQPNFPQQQHLFKCATDPSGAIGFEVEFDVPGFTDRFVYALTPRKGIAATLRRINPTVVSLELDSLRDPQKVIVAHRLKDKILPLELRQESDGFRRFYAHLLAVYQTPPKQTLVFEEPENGIYPGALELLADEFKAAPDAGRGQVLLTTHSPALLDQFSSEHIRVVELVDLETRIGPLAEEQREALSEELLHAGELLTVDPARLRA